MEDKRLVKKRYIFMSVIFLGLAILTLFLPEKYSSTELNPKKLHLKLISRNRFVSTDYVADRIINQDAYFQLIDVRTPAEYEKFHLPGALNIPLANILDKDDKGNYVWEDILNQDIKQNVFYSNGDTYANQAWIVTERLNFQNNYIMEGGLNRWVQTILMPEPPDPAAPMEAFDLYRARVGAGIFFGGGTAGAAQQAKPAAAPAIKIKRKQSEEEEGGC